MTGARYLKPLEKFLHYCMTELVFIEWMDGYTLCLELDINSLKRGPGMRPTFFYIPHGVCASACYYSWQPRILNSFLNDARLLQVRHSASFILAFICRAQALCSFGSDRIYEVH